ncbi:zinc finger protein 385D-like [Lampetra planeri]
MRNVYGDPSAWSNGFLSREIPANRAIVPPSTSEYWDAAGGPDKPPDPMLYTGNALPEMQGPWARSDSRPVKLAGNLADPVTAPAETWDTAPPAQHLSASGVVPTSGCWSNGAEPLPAMTQDEFGLPMIWDVGRDLPRECPQRAEAPEEGLHGPQDVDGHREAKKSGVTFCEICNIQLNSRAQTQIHYNGKSHRKRIRQLAKGWLVCTGTVDPVQKAVITHTFGVPILPRRKHSYSCSICQTRFNSETQAIAHFKGNKHAKRLKSLEGGMHKQSKSSGKDEVKRNGASKPDSMGNKGPNKAIKKIPKYNMKSMNLNVGRETHGAGRAVAELDTADKPSSPSTASGDNGKLPQPDPASASGGGVGGVAAAAGGGGGGLEGGGEGGGSSSSSISSVNSGTATLGTETEDEKSKRLLYCSLCKVVVNSQSQLDAHNNGVKHKTMFEAWSGGGSIRAFPRPGCKVSSQNGSAAGFGLQDKTFYCEICDVHVNSETQLKQHITSRRHKDRSAGKPPKPKFSPYNKQHRHSGPVTSSPLPVFEKFSGIILPTMCSGRFVSQPNGDHKKKQSIILPPIQYDSNCLCCVQTNKQAGKVSFARDLRGKPLAFLPASLAAAAAAAAAANPLGLAPGPPNSSAPSIFTSSPLGVGQPSAMLRPSPGPIRQAHGSFLFAPY